MSASLKLEFGRGVPVKVSPEAKAFLEALPQPALARVLTAVSKWSKNAPVKAASVITFTDPEDVDWTEAIIQLAIDADTDGALALWDEVGEAITRAMEGITADQRAELDQKLGVHLLWGANARHVE
jgi:hypothetical protein